ncbi:hypothetical protein FH972_017587 [Carpinus fangiana]|uniref:Uncharacterized protein n=1 Tax=Carpinus fangiana TaxID=176857 RepID=A0A5N6RJC6_9ROSI|nr:hypothetical protein FH972_017587 [Carpinus fangiana]
MAIDSHISICQYTFPLLWPPNRRYLSPPRWTPTSPHHSNMPPPCPIELKIEKPDPPSLAPGCLTCYGEK